MDPNSAVKPTTLPGVFQIKRETFSDDRGFFRESVRIKELENAINKPFVVAQVNHARSIKNTLRGIHVAPWNKLIYVVAGTIQAVVVDTRRASPTFGKHESFILGEENRASLFVPAGCGNSYAVLSEDADYTYLTDQEYVPNKEIGIMWNDPSIGIKWEISGEPLLSERDKQLQSFRSLFPEQ